MGGEDQLKALIRHGFALQNTADKAVLRVDNILAQSMANVKRLIEQLPEESLLRNQSWKQLQPIVQEELKAYGDQLGAAVADALVDAAPDMEQAAIRQAQLGGADFGPEYVRMNPAGGRAPDTVAMALNSQVSNTAIKKLFNLDGNSERSAVDKALFRTVDTRVRAGIIEGKTTEQIAREMATDVQRQGVPGISLSDGVPKQIRSQAMAIARTATQDMARQVKEQVYEANSDAMEGMVWLWSAALDSRTCETCGPLDGQRWDKQNEAPSWPLHPNCRCQLLPIDPEDDFWNEPEITAQQIRPVKDGPYKGDGAYKTPITVKGKKYYRKAVPVTSDTPPPRYSDVLAKWATGSQESLKAALGPQRADFFTKQFNKFNKDPQQILEAMLTGKSGAQKWIPVEKLQTVKVKPKPKPKVLAKPNPKAKPKAAVPAPKSKAPSKPKFRTADTNYDYDKNWEKLGYESRAQYRKARSDVIDWSGEDFAAVRAAQFNKIQKAGGELNRYEQLQVRRLESGEARRFGSMADRLEDFVERAPKFDGELRRGVALDSKEQVKDLIERYSKGDANRALESWTTDKSVSDRFAFGNGAPRAERVSIIVENNTKGAPINGISGFADESEVLVPSGVRYELVEVEESFVKGSGKPGDVNREDHTNWVLKLRELAD